MTNTTKYGPVIKGHLLKVNNVQLTPELEALQRWQANRLMNTHDELYQQERFKPAMEFFRDELYCATHFHQRNTKLIQALPLMCRTMPASVLDLVVSAAHLHALSLELDQQLLKHLANTDLSMASYIQAYKQCSNPIERALQIDLIEALGLELESVIHKPAIRKLLKWAKLPAAIAGYGEIHHFVWSGYQAFNRLERARDFVLPVVTKERELSSQWFNS
jgi:hypothetical protein